MQSRQRCFGWKQVLATLMTLLLVVQVVMPIPQALACSGNGITDQGVVAAQGIDVPSAEENQMLQIAEAGKAGEPDELPGELGPRSSSTPALETVQLIVDVCGNYDEATFAVFLPDGDTTPVTLQGPNEDKSVWPVVGSRVTARLTTYHQDGNWHYWFSKVVTGSGTWVLDDAFSAKLELDSPGYLVAGQLEAEHYLVDGHGNRLEAIFTESVTEPGGTGSIVPRFSIGRGNEEIFSIKQDQPRDSWWAEWYSGPLVHPLSQETTFFGAAFPITADLAGGQYTAKLELPVAPETTISSETVFTIINENAAPVLQVEPAVLGMDQEELTVSGVATPNATVSVSYRREADEPIALEHMQVGLDGKFLAENVPAPTEEGTYTFTAVGIMGGVQSDPSQPVTIIVDHTPPTKPVLSTVSYRSGGLADLAWEAAVDNFGVAGYKVFRALAEGTPEAVAEVLVTNPGQPLTWQDTGLLAETQYTYGLQAVDMAGNQSKLGNPLTITTDPISLDSVGYQLSTAAGRIDLGQINQGAKLTIKLVGETGRIASAAVNYLSSLDELSQPMATPLEATATVTLSESPALPGTYLGEFIMTDDIIEVSSITGRLADVAGHAAVKTLASQLQVTGSLKVNFSPADAGQLTNYQLLLHSASTGQGSSQRLGTAASYTFSGLRSGPYTLRLLDVDNRQVGSWEEALLAGQQVELTLPVIQPARLRVRVLDPQGNYLSGQRVSFWNNASQAQTAAVTDEQGWARPNLVVAAGDEVGVTVTLSGTALALPCPDRQSFDLTLTPGVNEPTLQLRGLTTVTVQGRVLPPAEIPALSLAGITVTAVQMLGARSISVATTTDAAGNYRLQVPWGKVAFSAATEDAKYVFSEQNDTDVPEQGLRKNLQLSTIGKADINMTVRTRFLDQADGVAQDLDWRSGFYFYFSAQDAYGWSYQSYPLNLFAAANDTVTIRVDGSEQGLPMIEQQVQLDAERKGEVEFYLEEQGRIIGSVLDHAGEPIDLEQLQSLRVIVFTVDGQGKQSFLMQRKLVANTFKISVPHPGKYAVQIVFEPIAGRRLQYTASIGPFDVGLNEIKNLGAVRVAGSDAASMQGALMATPAEVSPGSVLTMWAEFSDIEGRSLENAQLSFAMPAGCQLVSGSFAINGQPLVGNGPSFSLGDIELLKNQRQLLTWQVQVAADLKGTDLIFFADLDWTEGGKQWHKTLVPANVRIAQLTLDTPAMLQRLTTIVSGRGPVGATVKVYNERLLLGQTQVSPAGYWRLPIVLPNRGVLARFQLHAVANLGEKEWHSPAQELLYDSRQVVLEQVILRQDEGNSVTIKPGDGVALFPYVIHTGEGQFEVTLKFNKPDLVQRARASIKPFTADATRKGDDFVAKVPFNSWDLGALYVDFITKPDLSMLQQQAPTEAQWRQRLPVLLRSFEAKVLEDKKSVEYVVPGLSDMAGTVALELEEIENYTPTEADLAFESETGLPVYGLNWSAELFSVDGDGRSPEYVINVEAFIPKEFIENPGFQRMRGLSAAGGANTAIRVATRLVKKAGPDGALNAVDWTGALIDGFGVPDKFDELGKMLDTAVSCGENSTHYREQIDQMSMLVMGGEVAKWGLQLAGVLLGPETFGVGTVLLFGASKGVEYAIDKQIERHINGLKADMRTDLDCKLKDDDDPTKKIADPRWIFDPSGNVYEGLFENPLQGVLATVLEKVEHAGKTVMIPWDAEWYGQINQQLTDINGYYGWDVPQGEWQVIYEKDGYLPAQSSVMTVPPPRTGVNINLQSLAAPQVIGEEFATDGTHVDIAFDKYMLASTLNTGTISVTFAGLDGDEFVPGRVELIDPVSDAASLAVSLCKQVRFIPGSVFDKDTLYQVVVSSAAQSYAGIPLGVKGAAVPPVGEVINAHVVADNRTIALTWTDPAAANLSQVKLAWKVRGTADYLGSKLVAKGTQRYTISSLVNGTEYEVLLTTVDSLGNESTGVKLWVTPRAPIIDPPIVEWPDEDLPVIEPPEEETPAPDATTKFTVELDGEEQILRGLAPEIVLCISGGTFAAGTQFSVQQLTTGGQQLTPGLSFASSIHALAAGEVAPAKPFSIMLPYDTSLLDDADARLLGVYRQDAEKPNLWHYVGGVLNAATQQLTVKIDKLGSFAVLLNRPVFSDVVGHWARGDVTILAARHLIAGVGGGKFDPDRPITRAELATLLARLMKYDPFLELNAVTDAKAVFADVAADAWYRAVLQTCVRMGIVKTDEKNFRPSEPATREEMAVMMLRAMEAMGEPHSGNVAPLPFKDAAKISAAALDEVTRAWNKGLMRGVGNDLFSPAGTSTRAQAATVMLRLLQQLGMVTID